MLSYANASVLYVSKKLGNPLYSGLHFEEDGSGNGPLPSIGLALQKVGQMRRAGNTQPVCVKLLDQEYDLDSCLEIVEQTSGLHNNALASDITIEPFGSEKVLISGGKKLVGFIDDEFNGYKCWSIEIDEVKSGKWEFCDLYVNGRHANRTRWPKEGYLLPQAVQYSEEIVHSRNVSEWFIIKEGDLPANANMEKARIKFGHFWVQEDLGVAQYDPQTRKCTFVGKPRYVVTEKPNTAASMQYYIENLAEAFGRAGDFYLDQEKGKLYYMPLEGESKETAEIYAPKVKKIFSVCAEKQTGGIRFKNIRFAHTKGDHTPLNSAGEIIGSDPQCVSGLHGAIELENANHCDFENCDFFAIGGYGVKCKNGCHHIQITNCTFKNMGGGAVSINGGDITMPLETQTHDIKVKGCEMVSLGRKYIAACGILLQHGFDCEFSENEIHDVYYSGICLGWVWGYKPSVTHGNKVCNNHIYDLGKGVLSDMGGVYLLGRQDHTIVSGNIIHDVKSRDYGGWALYADEGSQNLVFENNICYNVSGNCFHQHYGRANVIRNNVFALAGEALIRFSLIEGHTSGFCYQNVLIPGDKPIYQGALLSSVESDRNLIYANVQPKGWLAESLGVSAGVKSFETIKEKGIDAHSLIAPCVDIPYREMTQTKEAMRLGIQAIKE